jgi:hypothetical protein
MLSMRRFSFRWDRGLKLLKRVFRFTDLAVAFLVGTLASWGLLRFMFFVGVDPDPVSILQMIRKYPNTQPVVAWFGLMFALTALLIALLIKNECPVCKHWRQLRQVLGPADPYCDRCHGNGKYEVKTIVENQLRASGLDPEYVERIQDPCECRVRSLCRACLQKGIPSIWSKPPWSMHTTTGR